ncbi:hypothetical protein M8J77_012631 [Diaphorina citri]|nr:hypothetical protein M8J77_012631 [Diaphorina citri]
MLFVEEILLKIGDKTQSERLVVYDEYAGYGLISEFQFAHNMWFGHELVIPQPDVPTFERPDLTEPILEDMDKCILADSYNGFPASIFDDNLPDSLTCSIHGSSCIYYHRVRNNLLLNAEKDVLSGKRAGLHNVTPTASQLRYRDKCLRQRETTIARDLSSFPVTIYQLDDRKTFIVSASAIDHLVNHAVELSLPLVGMQRIIVVPRVEGETYDAIRSKVSSPSTYPSAPPSTGGMHTDPPDPSGYDVHSPSYQPSPTYKPGSSAWECGFDFECPSRT